MDYFLYMGIKVAQEQNNWQMAGRVLGDYTFYLNELSELIIYWSGGEEDEEQED